MYEATTHLIRVRATPHYLDDRSDPDERRYFWAYTIEIANLSAEPVQLKSRYWRITDETGRIDEVRGPGVVGETPVLVPGGSYKYTSGCPLPTPSGIMVGQFYMVTDAGSEFAVDIPAFSLDIPDVKRAVN